MTGLVNISNTYGAIRGTDIFYLHQGSGSSRYRRSFYDFRTDDVNDGAFRGRAFSPFVSSIGLLTQTGDSSRKSFICGSALCLLVAITPLTQHFARYSTGDQQRRYAGLLFTFTLFRFGFSQQITFTARNIYHFGITALSAFLIRASSGLFTGSSTDGSSLLLSNGLLVGILLAVLIWKILFRGNALNNMRKQGDMMKIMSTPDSF